MSFINDLLGLIIISFIVIIILTYLAETSKKDDKTFQDIKKNNTELGKKFLSIKDLEN